MPLGVGCRSGARRWLEKNHELFEEWKRLHPQVPYSSRTNVGAILTWMGLLIINSRSVVARPTIRVSRLQKQMGSCVSTATYIHTDHLGSTRVCTDCSGNALGNSSYESFGDVWYETGQMDK